jgi:hypothetical protein
VSATASILSILASVAGVVAGLFRRPSRRRQLELDVHAARAASATGDASEANRIAERNRVRRTLPAIFAAAALLLSGCGCQSIRGWLAPEDHAAEPRTVVVSADRWMYPMTNDHGTAGWFVPAAVHAEMMEALVLVEGIRAKKGP